MRPLEQKKLLTIIAAQELEETVIRKARKRGIGGYTVVPARGAGHFGIQSGMLGVDSNILIYIILSEERLQTVLEDIDDMMNHGHRLKAIITDITILPRKPSTAL